MIDQDRPRAPCAVGPERAPDVAGEYVTDVPYVRAFHPELSPGRLRLLAGLSGVSPPPADEFDYCELGSAHGDTTATLAAAYPRARFVGVDLIPEHIASARALATRGGLENVRFVERDFEDLGAESMPDFDYVTAHGVMSWIGPTKRKAMLDFAAAHLKPGGLLYLSYNALPGWAPLEPLRQLLYARASLAPGSSVERARAGVEFARQLARAGAGYFVDNPAARTMLEKIDQAGLEYVAHEYLHAHWTPMYFAQVAAEMVPRDLHFIGQIPPYTNCLDVAVPQGLVETLRGVQDRVAFEGLKDFALNEYFRRDVFVKGRPAHAEEATRRYLDGTLFGPPLTGGPIPREVRFPHHRLEFTTPIFDVLLPALEAEAATPVDLAARPALEGFGLPRVRDAVLRLALCNAITPMTRRTRAVEVATRGTLRLTSTFDDEALRAGLSAGTPVALASEAAGTGVELSTVEALALLVVTRVPEPEREAWLRERCRREAFRLVVRGREVIGEDERARTLGAEVSRFCAVRLPRLLQLGVVTG
jgi:SAM-dependent methyltransferase